jgi:hypothetical protein
VDRPTPVPARPALAGEVSLPLARPVRHGTGAGVAPDLGAAGTDEAAGAVPTPASARSGDGRSGAADAVPEPLSVVATTAGIVQLIGWVPRRRPLRWDGLTDGDDLGNLWWDDLDGEATR